MDAESGQQYTEPSECYDFFLTLIMVTGIVGLFMVIFYAVGALVALVAGGQQNGAVVPPTSRVPSRFMDDPGKVGEIVNSLRTLAEQRPDECGVSGPDAGFDVQAVFLPSTGTFLFNPERLDEGSDKHPFIEVYDRCPRRANGMYPQRQVMRPIVATFGFTTPENARRTKLFYGPDAACLAHFVELFSVGIRCNDVGSRTGETL